MDAHLYFKTNSNPDVVIDKSIEFDLSIVKERDELKVAGTWYKVHDNWRGKCIQKGYNYIKLEDIEEIEDYRKYVPMKQKAPLPKSPYLTEAQVKRIYNTLEAMPKTNETKDMKIKPIGLKLFGPNFNLYVVETDKGSYEDEFESMYTQCFGYVENLSAPECSEWGYINIPYYLEVGVKVPVIGTKGGIIVGFEQDLYFENRYITQSGKILTKEEMEHLK